MTKQTDADMIAKFLATRGVTKVAEGDRSYDGRAMHQAVRGHAVLTIEQQEASLIDRRHVTIGANGREYVTNGLGERIS